MVKDSEERYPIHSSLDVIDGKTIHKESGWWRAVVFYEKGSEREIALYWWRKNEDGGWKNIHKWKILDLDTWDKERQAIESFLHDNEHSEAVDKDNSNAEQSIEEVIEDGEGVRVEFKETFVYDVYQEQANKELKAEVAKEVCSFANAQGGTLIIGVEDGEGEIKGIDRDLRLIKSKDDFELQLNRTIRDKLGESFASLCTRVEFNEVENSEICVVTVDRSPDPVFYGDEDDFYVRLGSSKNPLSIQEANKYINQNWA